jgi:hypothetical protein
VTTGARRPPRSATDFAPYQLSFAVLVSKATVAHKLPVTQSLWATSRSMPAVQGFQLTEDDIEILHRVFDLRVAHIDHLSALTARSQKALSRRLFKLTERRFLARIERRPEKHLYAIGPVGVPVLIEHGYAPRDLAAKRLRHGELKEIFLRHLLFVVDIHVKLLWLTRQGPVKLTNWQEGPVLWDAVTIRDPDGRGVTLPIRPDASFTLSDTRRPSGKDRFYFFLEADRSTMSHARMTQKIIGYLNYFQQALYRRKYPGLKTFGVATITETRARAASLSADLAQILPSASRRAYRFTAFEDLSLAALVPHLLDAQDRAA